MTTRSNLVRTAALAAALVSRATAGSAQDAGTLGELAALLAVEDRREFDAAVLRTASRHPEPLVRARTAVALGRLGDRSGTPILLELLADPDSSVRVEAAFALGQLRDPDAVAELAQRLQALPDVTQGEVELEIVTALAKIGTREAALALDAHLERHPPDRPSQDRATSVALLEAWRLGPSSPPAARLPAYAARAEGEWRRNAVFSAVRLRLPQAARALLEAADDEDRLTRSYAARALTSSLADSARIPRDVFVGRLRALAGDDDAHVRINALRALASFADSNLAGVAASRLQDRDPNVEIQAAEALGSLGGSRAVTTLVERFAAAPTFGLRRAVLLALSQAAPDTVPVVGRPWRTDPDWRHRAAFVEALGAAATPASRSLLLALLVDPDPRVVAAALEALGQLTEPGDPAARDSALSRISHPDVGVRAASIDLLGRTRDPALLPDLVSAYRRAEADESGDARLAAVAAIGQLAQVSPAALGTVERVFLQTTPRSSDYLIRRAVAERLGAEVHRRYWGSVLPVETGRSEQDYRQAAARYILRVEDPGPMRVTIQTDRGAVEIALFPQDAPLTVDNFVRLVDRRYFDNGRWHRVVPNFVAQDGDPRGDGNGGPGYAIRDEINRRRYARGTVGMALAGPDTGGSQFFITHSPQPHLDGGYTVFGRVVGGFDVLDNLVQGDRIRRVSR